MAQVDLDRALRQQVADEAIAQSRGTVLQAKRSVIAAELARDGQAILLARLEGQDDASAEDIGRVRESVVRLDEALPELREQLRRAELVADGYALARERLARTPALLRP